MKKNPVNGAYELNKDLINCLVHDPCLCRLLFWSLAPLILLYPHLIERAIKSIRVYLTIPLALWCLSMLDFLLRVARKLIDTLWR